MINYLKRLFRKSEVTIHVHNFSPHTVTTNWIEHESGGRDIYVVVSKGLRPTGNGIIEEQSEHQV